MTRIDVDGFVSREEARQLAGGISRSTEWRWSQAGLFPRPAVRIRGKVLYRRADIAAWLADPPRWAAEHAGEGTGQ